MNSITSSTALWYATRATGIVALVLLTATIVLGILTAGRVRPRSWPAFAPADLHRRVSLTALVFLGLHIVTTVVDTYVHIGWVSVLVPFTSSYHRLWLGLGAVGVDMIAAVAISSALRTRVPARVWRGLHWLAYVSWPTGMGHALGMGTDAAATWMRVLAGVCAAAVVAALAVRVVDVRAARARFDDVAPSTAARTRHIAPVD